MTRRPRLYDVRIVVDRTVLNDILTYAEDHGEVLSIAPHMGDTNVPTRRRQANGPIHRARDLTIKDETYRFIAEHPGASGPEVAAHIGSMNKWKAKSASPALSVLRIGGYITQAPDGTYSVTAKKPPTRKKPPNVT